MSDDRLFERDARAWLELGPSTAPRRVVDAALLAIETTPQERDLRAPWRLPHLTIQTRFAVAAAVGLLVVGAGLLFVRNPQNQIGNPSPSPTALPMSSPSAITEALQARWTSVGARPWPGVADPVLFSDFTIDPSTLTLSQYKGEIESSWSINGSDQLTLRLLNNIQDSPRDWEMWNCDVGDEGSYGISLSSDGTTLTLSRVDDMCASRAELLAGDWTRWPCAATDGACLTELSQGRHVATAFKPFRGGKSGQFAYTVPSGWASEYAPPTWSQTEVPTEIHLDTVAAPEHATISLYSYVSLSASVAVPDSPPIDCPGGPRPTARTASTIAAWLTEAPYLTVAHQTPVTIGGLDGTMLDVSLASGWVDPCSWGQTDNGSREYSTSLAIFDSRTDAGLYPAVYLGMPEYAMARYIVLGRENDLPFLIAVQATDQASFGDLVAAAMPVIETFEFIP